MESTVAGIERGLGLGRRRLQVLLPGGALRPWPWEARGLSWRGVPDSLRWEKRWGLDRTKIAGFVGRVRMSIQIRVILGETCLLTSATVRATHVVLRPIPWHWAI